MTVIPSAWKTPSAEPTYSASCFLSTWTRSASSLRDASGKRGVFEAEFPAESDCALLDLRRFSRAAQRPQRLRPVVQCARKRRPCLHLLEEPDRVVKVRERRRPVRRRLQCECTTTGPQHPRLAIAVVHATRAAQGLVPAGHAGGQISELRVA